MPALELFQLYGSAHKSDNQTTSVETNLVGATYNDIKPQEGDMPYVPLLLAPVCFMVVWTIIIFVVSDAWKIARPKRRKANNNCSKQVPCWNCRFFNNNHYLKCAVNPDIVLTKQALNCSDYHTQ